MDQMLGTYTCKRQTNRWSLAMLFNVLYIAVLAAFIVYNEMDPDPMSDRRRTFLHVLIKQLATLNMEVRGLNVSITRFPRIRQAVMCFDKVPVKESAHSEAPPIASRDRHKLCQKLNKRQKNFNFMFGL